MADENGYTKMQAWDFMSAFGDVMRLECFGYHSTEIHIDSSSINLNNE
jgi:hypothetical protein